MRTYRKHFIRLVKDKHLHIVGFENTTLNHVLDTSWSSNHDLWTVLESFHILTNIRASNTGVALSVHEVANSNDNFLNLLGQLTCWSEDQSLTCFELRVDLLQNRNRESRRLAGSRLSLGNDIRTFRVGLTHFHSSQVKSSILPLITGMMARCWIADGRSNP